MRRVVLATVLLVATVAASAQARDLGGRSFRSPSDGIRCLMTGGVLLCVVHPAPPYANGAYGTLDTRTAAVGSVDDFGAGHPRTILRYGQRWSRGGLRCTMRTSGIECRNARGHGFRLSKRAQTAF